MSNDSEPSSPVEIQQQEKHAFWQMIGRLVGGAVNAVVMGMPLARVQAIQQLSPYLLASREPIPHGKNGASIQDVVEFLYKREGVLWWLKGVGIVVTRYIVENSLHNILITSFDTEESVAGNRNRSQLRWAFVKYFIKSGTIGAAVLLLTYPLSTAQNRILASTVTDRPTNLLYVINRDGFKSLYRGLGPALLGAFCFNGLYFALHDVLGKEYTQRRHKKQRFHSSRFLIPLLCQLVAQAATYPLDNWRKYASMPHDVDVSVSTKILSIQGLGANLLRTVLHSLGFYLVNISSW